MNRKDFDTLARAFKNMHGDITQFAIRRAAVHLAREIKQDNANFDEKKFLERCGL